MPIPRLYLTVLPLLTAAAAGTRAYVEPAPLDPAAARAVFLEARAVAARDGGRLWGISVAGPLLLVDPATRQVVASGPDPAGTLARKAGVLVGRFPDSVNVANTALDWGGRRWSMLMWPLPASRQDREALLAHELWHRIQVRMGLPAASPANAHLDTPEGRLWMRLEWHALAVALRSHDEAMRAATADALAFRRQRRALFAAAGAE